MASPPAPSSRASLLAGLRTGGVRSASQPHQLPHTAAPTGSFNIPRFASASHSSNPFPEEDEEDDQLAEMTSQTLNLSHNSRHPAVPMTASAADGVMGMYQQQQQQLFLRQLAAQRAAFSGGAYSFPGEPAELQAQMMQMELLKYQALQQHAQQYQAELIAQAQRQQRHASLRPPMTAGPNVTSFDHSVNTATQVRTRDQQSDYRSGVEDYGPVPMTAAIGGKFASRTLNPHANAFVAGHYNESNEDPNLFVANSFGQIPSPPNRTTVISGGTSLGGSPSISKSDAAVSWRRTSNNSVLRPSASHIDTSVNRSPPRKDEVSPNTKTRPQPLKFSSIEPATLPAVSVENVDEEGSSGSTSASSPTTPPSNQATLMGEAKKQYGGLGLGKQLTSLPVRHVSMPLRQPKGPPSGADELGPRNFATRLRRQALGGLGALVNVSRERREAAVEVQAY